jgi:hypothetical protein
MTLLHWIYLPVKGMLTPHQRKSWMPPAGRALLVIVAVLVALAGRTAAAQEPAPDLFVTVRDVSGAGVPEIRVLVRDSGGSYVIARGVTDAAGVAEIGDVRLSEIRVAVEGSLPDGTPLRQTGQDAAGVALFLGFGAATLDVRVEPDGLVIPDPATMITLDPGFELPALDGTVVIVETAPIAPTVVLTRPEVPADTTGELSTHGPAETPGIAHDHPATPHVAASPLAFVLLIGALIALGLLGVAYLRVQQRGRP